MASEHLRQHRLDADQGTAADPFIASVREERVNRTLLLKQSGCSSAIKAVQLGGMTWDPESRWESMEAFCTALEAAAGSCEANWMEESTASPDNGDDV